MAREKKIPINAFDKAVGEVERESIVSWNGLDITVKRALPYETMLSMCAGVAGNCFDENGTYAPEAKEVSLRLAILALYTNLSIPLSVDKRYEMACLSGVYEAIVGAINPYQYKHIVESVDERIRLRNDAAVESVVRQANDVAKAISDLRDKFDDQFSSLLGQVTPDEMGAVIRGIAAHDVDEEKVVRAYMDSAREIRNPEDGSDE